jgi:hypothetical protein
VAEPTIADNYHRTDRAGAHTILAYSEDCYLEHARKAVEYYERMPMEKQELKEKFIAEAKRVLEEAEEDSQLEALAEGFRSKENPSLAVVEENRSVVSSDIRYQPAAEDKKKKEGDGKDNLEVAGDAQKTFGPMPSHRLRRALCCGKSSGKMSMTKFSDDCNVQGVDY